jgi:4-hydroxybutyrate CoA-transferase
MYDASWKNRAVSAEQAVSHIKSGDRVFVHGASATPTPLIEALCKRTDLENVTVYHLHTTGPTPWASPEMKGRILSVSLFTGGAMREPIADGRADFMPVFLSDIPGLFMTGAIPLDVAILQLSPPNHHGDCTLGTSVDTAMAAAMAAKRLVAEINEQMPRTLGHSVVHYADLVAFVSTNRPLVEMPPPPESEVASRIGEIIAKLVEDGSCLQMGIGAIPDAVFARLGNKHDLGIHTEMFSDGLIPLIQNGNVTNKLKKVHPGRSVVSFVTGSKKLFDFVHDNQHVEFHPCDRTNDTALIRKNDKTVAINAAIEIDLSGQVCADSIGHRIYSGIGGQMDFIRGAALSNGGKAIIALPSTAANGTVSRIAMDLKAGAGVVTTRGHVHWIVTEYGAVNLHGKTLRERAQALISIAHPDFRYELRQQYAQVRHFTLS